MATTNGELAREAVDAVVNSEVHAVVLHGEESLAAARVTSDVDLVVDRTVTEVVAAVSAGWERHSLVPLIVWPYDVGGTGTVFLSTPDATDGVQLDLLHDPGGEGQYGARSDALLNSAEAGDRFERVSPTAAAVYLLSKRLRKGQMAQAKDVVAEHESAELQEQVTAILRADIGRVVSAFIASGEVGERKKSVGVGRLIRRVLRPVGAWVAVQDDTDGTISEALAARFGRFLPKSEVVTTSGPIAWIRRIAPLRWRAAIVFEPNGRRRIGIKPDVTVRAIDGTDGCAVVIVETLAQRTSRYRRQGTSG